MFDQELFHMIEIDDKKREARMHADKLVLWICGTHSTLASSASAVSGAASSIAPAIYGIRRIKNINWINNYGYYFFYCFRLRDALASSPSQA